MKINITKKEFRNLLGLLYLGEWMVTAHDEPSANADNPYVPLIQKFYSLAKEFGCEDLVEYSKEFQTHLPTSEFEESEVKSFVESYDENTFWGELVSRFIDRDFDRIPGSEDMELEKRFKVITELEQKYAEEFATNGLLSLELSESQPDVKGQ